jgi:hypothetical protein
MGVTREVGAAMLAALEGYFHPVLMVRLDWPSGVIRAHSGTGLLEYGGEIWTPVGPFGSVTVPSESFSAVIDGATLTIIGEIDELEAEADQNARGRECEILFAAATTREGTAIVGAPVSIYFGTVDGTSIQLSATTHQLSVTLGGGPKDRDMASLYHSHEDQSRRYPGDTAGLRLLAATARAQTLQWPEQ